MIGILLSSLFFLLVLISTLSLIPKTLHTKFLSLFSQNPPPTIKPTTSNQLQGVFATFDKNSDGYITKQELMDSLNSMGLGAGERDVTDMVERVDSNGDGLIDMDEFRGLFESLPGGGGNDVDDVSLKEAFDVFDGNGDGVITVEELGLVLSSLGFSEGRKMEDCKEMIRKVDVDGDGMVNFDEFKRMMKTGLIGSFFPVS